MFLQTRTATRTERMKQIVQLAIEDRRSALEQGRRETLKGGKVHVAPLVAYLQYHEAVLRAIERGELDNYVQFPATSAAKAGAALKSSAKPRCSV
jgi:hypothetical protein